MKFIFVSIYLTGVVLLSSAFFAGLGYHIGDEVVDFSLKGTDGQMHSLSAIPNAKGYVLVFTCNHCPFAVKYEDRLIDLHVEFAAQGYPVVAINSNDAEIVPEDSYANMIQRAREKEFPFRYLHDEDQEVLQKFGASKTPQVFLLDQDMIVRYIGAIDDNAHQPNAVSQHYLKNAIMALQQGSSPDPQVTKAVGCSVKVKL